MTTKQGDSLPHQQDGPSCPGCGLANYSGLCPVCRGDAEAYERELQPHFGPWFCPDCYRTHPSDEPCAPLVLRP